MAPATAWTACPPSARSAPRMTRTVFCLCRVAVLENDYMRYCRATESQLGQILHCLPMCRARYARRDCALSTRSEPDSRSISIELRRTQPEHCVSMPLQAFAKRAGTSAVQTVVNKVVYCNLLDNASCFNHLGAAQSRSMPGIRAFRLDTIFLAIARAVIYNALDNASESKKSSS